MFENEPWSPELKARANAIFSLSRKSAIGFIEGIRELVAFALKEGRTEAEQEAPNCDECNHRTPDEPMINEGYL
jgi:hypothetical protein